MADDLDLIELIDVDPVAFGPSPASPPAPEPPRTPRQPRGAAFWARLGMTASVVLMLGLGAFAVVVRPWEGDGSQRFTDPLPSTSELTDRLVFDPAPAELRSTSMGGLRTNETFDLAQQAVGYIWGEETSNLGSINFPESVNVGRMFAFYGVPVGSDGGFTIAPQRTIAGAPAEVSDESGGASIELAWGPLDGIVYRARATNTTVDAAVAFAEALRVDGRDVHLAAPRTPAERAARDGLLPLGSFGDYIALFIVDEFGSDFDQPITGYTGLYYGFSGQSVGSLPGRPEALDLLPHTIAKDVVEGEVHGLRALGYTRGAGPFGGQDRSAVVWAEGGRLILVQGDGDLDATFALAQTVRPATNAEWAEAEAIDR